jgi:arginase
MTQVVLIGVPMDAGQQRAGCVMGPAAYRVAGLAEAIALASTNLRVCGGHTEAKGASVH